MADSSPIMPVKIRVRWSEHKGYIAMQNPVDGKVCFVLAKGLPRWVFDRMDEKPKAALPAVEFDSLDLETESSDEQ